jgi:hypothetical protein
MAHYEKVVSWLSHTVRYTEFAPERFATFWKD